MGIGGMIKMGSQIAQAQFQQQQESMTGSEETEHLTEGVHWLLQTRSYGAMPVTRWFSSDFCTAGEFLYITQKVKGQGSSASGFFAGLGKMMMHQALSVYGFGVEYTLNLDGAQFITSLDQNLEISFSVFASSDYIARQIVNPWVIAPLVDWAYRYPLKTIQTDNQIFGQLAVMFCPQGVYVASAGTMIPEAVEELTTLGIALVKAQVSTFSRPAVK